mmetsp:Transcript_18787/g.31417  ORF Transcript_18787/g.31417 Transcript_18787/m.31417 type:complete len:106 (-) Transcript_18787:391-708(-)
MRRIVCKILEQDACSSKYEELYVHNEAPQKKQTKEAQTNRRKNNVNKTAFGEASQLALCGTHTPQFLSQMLKDLHLHYHVDAGAAEESSFSGHIEANCRSSSSVG